jgi:hypothetical protein
MTTQAQIIANRQNAALSSGPKSPEGKAASSQNATRHGLSGQFTILPHESRQDFDDLVTRLRTEFTPQGENETFLVDQMIQSRWKLDRIGRLEALAMEQILTDPAAADDPDARLLGAMSQNNNILDKLARYSAAAERSYYKALRELQAGRVRTHKADVHALDAYIKKFINVPVPGELEMKAYCLAVNDFAKKQNEPKSAAAQAPARPVLTPEELAHPALRL